MHLVNLKVKVHLLYYIMYKYFPVEKEQKMLNDYISANPFPSEGEFIIKIRDFPGVYSKHYYDITKKLYENITNEILCRKVGRYIDHRWGFNTMKLIYCFVRDVSPLSQSNILRIRHYSYNITIYWDGIGYWEH